MISRTLLLLFVIIGLAISPGADGWSQQRDQDRAYRQHQQQDLMKYGEIKKRAEKRFGGRVVGQSFRDRNDPPVYILRILRSDSSVLEVIMDARNAQVIKVKGD